LKNSCLRCFQCRPPLPSPRRRSERAGPTFPREEDATS
jgi:hypothetical protein